MNRDELINIVYNAQLTYASAEEIVEEIRDAILGQPLHEWECPACGATTRARMADRERSTSEWRRGV